MISNAEINKSYDFEVVWVDSDSQPKDMNSVTFEVYHYNPSLSAEVISPNLEPYIITETISDTLGVTTTNVIDVTGTYVTVDFITLDLNYTVDQLEGLGCPPNDFVVPGTNNKVSIVNGKKVFSLSACELSTLINLRASGYTAEDRNGYLVLKTATTGSTTNIVMDYGTLNPIIGLPEGTFSTGNDVALEYDLTPSPMTHVSTGKYVYSNLKFVDTQYILDKRYYAYYRAVDPDTLLELSNEEDFIIIKPVNTRFNFSFTR